METFYKTTPEEKQGERLEFKPNAVVGNWFELRPLTADETAALLGGGICPLCGLTAAITRTGVNGVMALLKRSVLADGRSHLFDASADCPHLNAVAAHKKFMDTVPKHFQHMKFPIRPHGLPNTTIEFQRQVIKTIEAHPSEGFIFSGPAGCGKTALSTALYHDALDRLYSKDWLPSEPSIWKLKLNDIITAEREWRTRDLDAEDAPEDTREFTPDMIANAAKQGHRPSFFLEEMDKIGKITEFRAEVLFALMNALYESDAQMVIDTNLSLASFEEYFKSDENYDGTIVRRVFARCWQCDYFERTITPPSEEE